MGVVLNKGGRSGHLECDSKGCTNKSKTYTASSPAAPALTICEAANEAENWGYSIGFQAMLFGHIVYCPGCACPTAS